MDRSGTGQGNITLLGLPHSGRSYPTDQGPNVVIVPTARLSVLVTYPRWVYRSSGWNHYKPDLGQDSPSITWPPCAPLSTVGGCDAASGLWELVPVQRSGFLQLILTLCELTAGGCMPTVLPTAGQPGLPEGDLSGGLHVCHVFLLSL